MTKQKENRVADICNAVSVRSEAESNRCSSFCRAVPSHSAIRPYLTGGKDISFFRFCKTDLPETRVFLQRSNRIPFPLHSYALMLPLPESSHADRLILSSHAARSVRPHSSPSLHSLLTFPVHLP